MLDTIYNDVLPKALMIGVDYDLFWTLNPKSLSPFTKAFSLKQDYDNTVAWSQGLYIRLAIASCLDGKVKYPNKPLNRGSSEPMSTEEIKRRMLAQMALVNERFRKEG